ncbi:MAG TPA: helix-turn-helix domain-containing protein [Rubellimicrobium sp.]|jgi:AraC-like DNA-binding protein|nr:helix-turn-helix domain-containing protein [Rubellimicrobium sp.]
MSDAGISFRYFLPAPALRGAITTYYILDVGGEGLIEELLFPEWANIRLLLDGEWSQTFRGGRTVTHAPPIALMSGVISGTVSVRGSPGRVVGAGFLPAGWAVFTPLPARDYVDDIVPLSALIGPSADALTRNVLSAADDAGIVAALDAWFLAHMASGEVADDLLVAAHEALLDPEVRTVAEWARRLDRSPRQLERLALAYFGLGPKTLLRRQRFLRSFAAIREHPPGLWGRMIDPGYVDHSQFVRDFHHFMGMAPRAYFARDFSFMRAAGKARAELLGEPLHALHAAAPAKASEG